MSKPSAPLPAHLPPVFTTREARAAGVGAARLRSSDIRTLARGLYARAGTGASAAQIVRALCFDDPSAFACGQTAAELLEMPIPRGLTAVRSWTVHVASPRKHEDSALIRWHMSSDAEAKDAILVGGVRATTRISTWCDLALLLRSGDLVSIADHLVRRPRPRLEGRTEPYASLDDLAAALEARRGRRGVHALRDALDRARVGSDSPAETRLRLALEDAGLPEPRLNARTHDGGVDLGEPDLSWPRYRVCLEHEGPRHLTRAQQERDIERTERRVSAGWIEVRTVATDLHEGCSRAVIRVDDALRRHGWTR
ncbi:hypothetical protein [Brachybacterium sp. NPDC056505]|uniref:hypothetical protein n=1 Tax=Brachybacterium sp. NPDC056505 TaxID=3345843 RepID=UPI00366F6BF1